MQHKIETHLSCLARLPESISTCHGRSAASQGPPPLECLDSPPDVAMEGLTHPSPMVLSDHLVQLAHCNLFLPECQSKSLVFFCPARMFIVFTAGYLINPNISPIVFASWTSPTVKYATCLPFWAAAISWRSDLRWGSPPNTPQPQLPVATAAGLGPSLLKER